MTKLEGIYAQGFEALEAGELTGVTASIEAAREAGANTGDARIAYLEFMSVWLDESADEERMDTAFSTAEDILEQGVTLQPPDHAARVVLDIADIMLAFGSVDEAEHALRVLSERTDLSPEAGAEARLLRAQILLDHHEDAEEALVQLDEVDPSLHADTGYISVRAAVLGDLDRLDEAMSLLEQAVAADETDTELHYQLGVMMRAAERFEDALVHLLTVRRQDLITYEVDEAAAVPPDEAQDLQRRLEDVLDTLPDPVIKRLGSAAIRVERWASEAAVKAGCDPRTSLCFEGQPDSDTEDDGHVDAVVIYRDAIIAQIEEDDEIIDALAVGLVEEFDRFFDLELIPGG